MEMTVEELNKARLNSRRHAIYCLENGDVREAVVCMSESFNFEKALVEQKLSALKKALEKLNNSANTPIAELPKGYADKQY